MANMNNISRVVPLLILLGNFGFIEFKYSEGKPLNRTCDAPVVTEGDTGVMTFFLRDSIDLESDEIFVSLTRAMKPDDVLATCKRKSPVKCDSQNPLYQISGTANHMLTLLIPNITMDFKDIYVLQVYVNEVPEPSDTCHLTVQERNSTRPCSAPSVKEGDTGVMTFFFHEDVVSSSNHLTAKLAKNGDGVKEILSCHRKVTHTTFKCEIKDKLYTIDGSVHHSLKMRIPRITQNVQGNYILEVMDHNTNLLYQSCYLRVEDVPADTKGGNEIPDHVENFIVIIAVLVIIAICLIIIVFRQAISKCLRSCKQRIEAHLDGHDESATPLLRINGANQQHAHEGKRWFYKELPDEEESQMSDCKRNAPGSFLVKVSPNNPRNYILKVLCDRGIKYLTLVLQTNNRLLCPSTGKSCKSLCEFVDYYRKHDIKVKNRVWGRLTRPFEREPNSKWYCGEMTDDQTKEILQRNEPGSFLVKVSCHDEDSYDLCLNNCGKIHYFAIVPDDDGFLMLDKQTFFDSVDSVVNHYTNHELKFDDSHNYGKLCKAYNRESEDNA